MYAARGIIEPDDTPARGTSPPHARGVDHLNGRRRAQIECQEDHVHAMRHDIAQGAAAELGRSRARKTDGTHCRRRVGASPRGYTRRAPRATSRGNGRTGAGAQPQVPVQRFGHRLLAPLGDRILWGQIGRSVVSEFRQLRPARRTGSARRCAARSAPRWFAFPSA